MIQSIIIDDNKEAAEKLAQSLKKYSEIQVMGIANNGMGSLDLIDKFSPNVLFLDIELPDISGLDFLDHLGNRHLESCLVVIYTAYASYILPAFRKKVFDVLLKPIEEKELDGIVQRIKAYQKEKSPKQTISKKNGKQLFFINKYDFHVVDNKEIGLFQYNQELRCWEVIVANSKSPIKLKRNVKGNALVSSDDSFVQVNQKFIININYLLEVIDNLCVFYPPFEYLNYVKVGCWYRRKLIERFTNNL